MPDERHMPMKSLGLLMAAALLAACQDSNVMGTDRAVATIDAPAAANARIAIDDVVNRIVPTLGDDVDARRLAGSLRALQHTMRSGSVDAGGELARAVRSDLGRYERLDHRAAAEVDAIRLALEVVY
jgi:hypothetical protein